GEVLTGLILKLAGLSPFGGIVAFFINMLWVAFSLFIGAIQAYVFIILSSNYIGDKVNSEEE
ncbi:MAG: F0F1 ATP synthase subunit A, partial [Streptococcus sobrinus]